MDLESIIAQLRAELESIKHVITSLEKLYDLRKQREAGAMLESDDTGVVEKRGRRRKKADSADTPESDSGQSSSAGA